MMTRSRSRSKEARGRSTEARGKAPEAAGGKAAEAAGGKAATSRSSSRKRLKKDKADPGSSAANLTPTLIKQK